MLNEEKYYNLIMAIINWGYVHFYTPEYISFKEEEKAFFESLLRNRDCHDEFIEYLNSYLSSNIKEVKEFFEEGNFIFVSEFSENWEKAEEMFSLLNEINYINETTEYAIAKIDQNLSNRIVETLDKFVVEIIDWLEGEDFSQIRFIPFNELRKSKLEDIPEDKRYLFPWYDSFLEYEILDILENFEKYILALEKNIFRNIDILIYRELKRDNKFYKLLKEEFLLNKILEAYFSRANPLSLLRISDETNLKYPLPDSILEAGLIRTNIKLLENEIKKIRTKNEKIFWMFMAAFNCPGLDDIKRIDIFDIVITELGEIQIEEEKNPEIFQILQLLKRWSEGENVSFFLSEKTVQIWISKLENTAKVLGVYDFDLDEESLLQKIEELISLQLPSLKLSDIGEKFINYLNTYKKFINILKDTLEKKENLSALLSTMAESKINIEVANPIHLKLKKNENNKYKLIPEEQDLKEKNIDFKRLKRGLKGKKGIFWCGFYLSETDIYPYKNEILEFPPDLSDEIELLENDNFLIVVSEDKDKLIKFLKDFPNAIKSITEDEEIKTLINKLKDDFVFILLEII